MAKRQPQPQFNEDGTLKAASLKVIVEWDHEDFTGMTTFLFAAWDKATACLRNARHLKVTVGESAINECIMAALVENKAWWNAHWYGSLHGGRFEFRDRL